MTRYEQGFLTKCAEYGLDVETSVELMKEAGKDDEYPYMDAFGSLSGLAGKGDVARFLLEGDPSGKQDFRRYVLQATNPGIDYRSDHFSATLDKFLNANLREMRKRKMKRLLLEVINSDKNGGRGSYYPDDSANKRLVSALNNDKLDYLFSRKPWKGRDGSTFITASGKPIASVEIPQEDKIARRYRKIVQSKTGKKVNFLAHDPSSDTYSYVDDEGRKYSIDLEDPNETVYQG